MVPFTIFQRLSSLGSGGGVNAGTFPPIADGGLRDVFAPPPRLVLFYLSECATGRDNGHERGKQSHSVARPLCNAKTICAHSLGYGATCLENSGSSRHIVSYFPDVIIVSRVLRPLSKTAHFKRWSVQAPRQYGRDLGVSRFAE